MTVFAIIRSNLEFLKLTMLIFVRHWGVSNDKRQAVSLMMVVPSYSGSSSIEFGAYRMINGKQCL